jgi:hypothetical protein
MHPLGLRVYMSRSVRSELTASSMDTVKLPIKSHHSCCMRRRLSFIYLWTSLASLFIRRTSPLHFITLSVHFRSSCPSETEESVLLSTHENIFDLDTCGVGVVRSLAFYDIDLCISVVIYWGTVVIRYCAEVQSVFCACE